MRVDDVDDHGVPLDIRAEIDALKPPPPPPCSDVEFNKIMKTVPKSIDAGTVRRRLERRWSVYLQGVSNLASLGLLQTRARRERAHLKFVATARAFINAYTEQVDNMWEMQTHEVEAPHKNRRQPLIEEISALADWHQKHVERIRESRRASDLPKRWLILNLHGDWLEWGGEDTEQSLAFHRFIASASAPALVTHEKKLTPGAVRDYFRKKKPGAKPNKARTGRVGKQRVK
jgi:hypothetical protein